MLKKQDESDLKEFKKTYEIIDKICCESHDLFQEDLIEVIELISKKKYQEAIKLILDIIEEFKINCDYTLIFLGDEQWNGVIDKLLEKYGANGLIKKFGKTLLDPERPFHPRLIYSA